jgi:hypothetical protein
LEVATMEEQIAAMEERIATMKSHIEERIATMKSRLEELEAKERGLLLDLDTKFAGTRSDPNYRRIRAEIEAALDENKSIREKLGLSTVGWVDPRAMSDEDMESSRRLLGVVRDAAPMIDAAFRDAEFGDFIEPALLVMTGDDGPVVQIMENVELIAALAPLSILPNLDAKSRPGSIPAVVWTPEEVVSLQFPDPRTTPDWLERMP